MQVRFLSPDSVGAGSERFDRQLLLVVSALIFLDVVFFTALSPILPHYRGALHLSKSDIGILSGAYALGSLVVALPAGLLASKFGPRKVVFCGLALLAVASTLFGGAGSLFILEGTRLLQGVAGALLWSGGLTWLLSSSPASRRGEALGIAVGAGVLGSLVGPAIGGAAVAFGTGPVFTATVLVSLGFAVVVSGIPDASLANHTEISQTMSRLRRPPILEGFVVLFIPASCFGLLAVIAPLKLASLGAPAGMIAAVFMTTAFIEAVLGPIAGRASDRVGRQRPYAVGLAICGAALLLLALAPSLAMSVTALLVSSFGGVLCVTPGMAFLSDNALRLSLHQGMAVAISNMAWSSGQAAGGILAGVLSSWAGYSLPLFAVLAFLLAAALVTSSHFAHAGHLLSEGRSS